MDNFIKLITEVWNTGFLGIDLGSIISSLAVILLAFLLGIWGITFIFFTNIHQKLTNGYDHSVVDRLIQINWSRTILWSLRLIILFKSFNSLKFNL